LKPFDSTGAFEPSWKGGDLRRTAVRGAGVTVFSQAVVFLTQTAATVVLARLLAPGDFGLVAMVTTFSLLLMNFGTNGYSEAVIQREHVDHALASNLFWINIGAGVVLTLIFAAAGPLLSKFYADPRVAQVTVAMAVTILISQTSVVHLALLKRALRFSVTSLIDVVSNTISVVGSILLARAGWGYWALVGGLIARPLVQALGAFCLCTWIPGMPRRGAETGSVVRFAAHVYGRFSFNYLTRNTDNLLVGWRFGSVPLGLYKKAYDLFLLPANQLLTPVADVVLSTLSRLKSGSAEYKRYFLNGLSVLAFVGMGSGALLTLCGRDLIRIVLGPKWGPAGEIFMFFGPGIGIMLISWSSGMIHLSIGRADRWFRWVLLEFAVTVMLFVVGLHWGPVGVASAWTVSFWLLVIPAFWYAGQPIGFGVAPVLNAVWRYIVASLLAGIACAGIVYEFHSLMAATGITGAMLRVTATFIVFSALYIGAIIGLHGGPDPLYRFAGLLPDMLPRWLQRNGKQQQAPRTVISGKDASVPEELATSSRETQ
jgi:O-antigen/teichoic acid export membrane protein